MKYEVGDKVRIRENIIFTETANSYIRRLDDRVSVVKEVKGGFCLLKRTAKLCWSEDCLERVRNQHRGRRSHRC